MTAFKHLDAFRPMEGKPGPIVTVCKWCEQQSTEFYLRDVKRHTQLPLGKCASSLARLHSKGLLSRRKIMDPTARRPIFVYQWVGAL